MSAVSKAVLYLDPFPTVRHVAMATDDKKWHQRIHQANFANALDAPAADGTYVLSSGCWPPCDSVKMLCQHTCKAYLCSISLTWPLDSPCLRWCIPKPGSRSMMWVVAAVSCCCALPPRSSTCSCNPFTHGTSIILTWCRG